MIPAQSTLSSRTRRFVAIFLPAFVFILIARLAQGSSLNQVLCNSVMWASVATAFWITIRTHMSGKRREPRHNKQSEKTPGSPTSPGYATMSRPHDPA
jgi:hypothetical protein